MMLVMTALKKELVQLRLTTLDKELLKELAGKNQMSLSEYVRYLIRREAGR